MRGSVSDQSQGITAGDLWHDISGKSTKLGRKFGTDQLTKGEITTITSFFELRNCKISTVRAFTFLFYNLMPGEVFEAYDHYLTINSALWHLSTD